jgi:hypothetical protein
MPALPHDTGAADDMASQKLMGLTRPLLSVKPWRQADELEKPQGRRG